MGQLDIIYNCAPIPSRAVQEFEEKAFNHNLLLGCFGEDYIHFLIPEIFSLRKWALYEKGSTLTEMISEGCVETIEFGRQYSPLPSNVERGNFIIPEDVFSFFELTRAPPLFIEVIYDSSENNEFKARGVKIHTIESLSFNEGFLDLTINPEITKRMGLPVLDDSIYTFKIPKNYLPFITPQIRLPRRLNHIS